VDNFGSARSPISALLLSMSLLAGIATHEGFRSNAYIPVKGDVPTIGFGFTTGVKMGDKITPERALVRLLNEVEGTYAAGVRKCVTVPLFQHEYEAYTSLAYNIGVTAFCRKAGPGKPPNLIDLINAQRYEEACERINAFKYGPGKKILPGLVKRRAEESALCKGKKNGSSQVGIG